MKKVLKYLSLAILLAIIYAFVVVFYPRTPIISGYAAHSTCSCHFNAGRPQISIEKNDNDLDIIGMTSNVIDEQAHAVTSSIFGLRKRTAVYRPGFGCVLVPLGSTQPTAINHVPPKAIINDTLAWPYGKKEINHQTPKIQSIINGAFDNGDEKNKKTRVVLVVHHGKIVAEKYAPGFDKNTRQLGWSMTKSFVNALYGTLVYKNKIDINQPVGLPEWTDKRKDITFNNLLQMNSGLEWKEDYASISDATKMLFEAPDVSKIQPAKPLAYPIGTHWEYSSGTTNLLSGLLRQQFATHDAYLDYPFTALFNKLNMASAIMETDISGTFIGSSYGWATPRDWAKFGLLYLHDGIWNGERILPEGWVKYTSTPAAGSKGNYGSQFWLNAGDAYPKSPKDMFYCDGFQGQYVYILPSQDLVIVRMGLRSYPDFDADSMIAKIVATLDE